VLYYVRRPRLEVGRLWEVIEGSSFVSVSVNVNEVQEVDNQNTEAWCELIIDSNVIQRHELIDRTRSVACIIESVGDGWRIRFPFSEHLSMTEALEGIVNLRLPSDLSQEQISQSGIIRLDFHVVGQEQNIEVEATEVEEVRVSEGSDLPSSSDSPRSADSISSVFGKYSGKRSWNLRTLERLEEQAYELLFVRLQKDARLLQRVAPAEVEGVKMSEEVIRQLRIAIRRGVELRAGDLRQKLREERMAIVNEERNLRRSMFDSLVSESLSRVVRRFREDNSFVGEVVGSYLDKIKVLVGEVGSEERIKERVASLVEQVLNRAISNTSGSGARDVNGVLERLLELEASLVATQRLVRTFSEEIEASVETVLEKAKAIEKLAFVQSIGCRGGWFYITTLPAKVTYKYRLFGEDEIHEQEVVLGRYELGINLLVPSDRLSRTGVIFSLRNLDIPRDCSRHHPHAYGPHRSVQTICFGNIRESLLKLYREWNFEMMFLLLWRFVNSYTSNDCYDSVSRLWDVWGRERLPGTEVR